MIVRGRHPHLRQFIAALLLLAPSLALFIAFVGWPAVDALWVSTQDWTGFTPQSRHVGITPPSNTSRRSASSCRKPHARHVA